MWRTHRSSFLENQWVPDPDRELGGMVGNILRGWGRQVLDGPGLEYWDAGHPAWPNDNAVYQSLDFFRERARSAPCDLQASALERLQHELSPRAWDRIQHEFTYGNTPVTIAWIRWGCRSQRFRTKRAPDSVKFQQSYTSYVYVQPSPVSRTKVCTFPPVTSEDAQRAARAANNTHMSERAKQQCVVAPLEPNSGLHFLGRTNIKHGMRPTPWRDPSPLVQQHALEYFGASDVYEPDRLIVHPGRETYLADLATTLGDPPTYSASTKTIEGTIKRWGNKLGLRRVLADARWGEVGRIKCNGKATAGIALEGLGYTRAQCAESIKQLAGHVSDLSKGQALGGAGLWQLGGRAKRTTPANGEVLRSRAIIFNDGVNAAVSSMISQGIGEVFKRGDGDIKIGHRAQQGAASDARQSEGNEVEFEIDHKRFGFRLAEPLLVDAFGIIRAMLPPGIEWDLRILHEMAHNIIKTIILPGGWVYRATFGNWSGPWTSILDSICNWLATCSSLDYYGVKPTSVDLWIYGDDTLIGFKHGQRPPNLSPPDVQRVLKEKFGIYAGEWNLGNLSSYGSNPGATFLGCWNRNGMHGRPIGKWLDVSMLPERRQDGLRQQCKRIKYLSHAAVATRDNEDYFTSYFTFLNDRKPAFARLSSDALGQYLGDTFARSHANFSSGGVDWRDWEYGASTQLCELMSRKRPRVTELMRAQVTGKLPFNRCALHATWLMKEVGRQPIGLVGVWRTTSPGLYVRDGIAPAPAS
uniref:RdRp n=1 Tax=viral metagenome TaxID=1070528 RepID=A0A2V0RAJ8_9ZZZZ